MKLIEKYFPTLTEEQKRQFEALDALYHDWNEKINVISRKEWISWRAPGHYVSRM